MPRASRGGAIAASLVAFSAMASACGSNEPQPEPTNPNDPEPVTQTEEPIDDSTGVEVYGSPPEEETMEPEPTAAPAYGIAPPEEPPEPTM